MTSVHDLDVSPRPAIPTDDEHAVHLDRVRDYYCRRSSRLGYRYVLGQTKHFGWYEPGDRMWKFGPALRRMEDQVAERLALAPGSRVLDAGSGSGDVARRLAGRHGLRVTGIDVIAFNLEMAWHRSATAGLSDRTTFEYGDYHHLRYAGASFDGVYTMETLVHAVDVDQVLAEFARVLRPGGRLVMVEYSRTPAEQLTPAENATFDRICELGVMPVWRNLSHGALEKRMAAAGFVVESVEDVTARVLPMLRALAIIARPLYAIGWLLRRHRGMVNAIAAINGWRHRHAARYNIYVATKPTR